MTDRLYEAITNVKSKLTDDEVKELMICYNEIKQEIAFLNKDIKGGIRNHSITFNKIKKVIDYLEEIYNERHDML